MLIFYPKTNWLSSSQKGLRGYEGPSGPEGEKVGNICLYCAICIQPKSSFFNKLLYCFIQGKKGEKGDLGFKGSSGVPGRDVSNGYLQLIFWWGDLINVHQTMVIRSNLHSPQTTRKEEKTITGKKYQMFFLSLQKLELIGPELNPNFTDWGLEASA